MKLELKHLAPYLPYGLKCDFKSDTAGRVIYGELTSLSTKTSYEVAVCVSLDIAEMVNLEDLKPILRPLSDLTKAEKENLGEILGLTISSVKSFLNKGLRTDFRHVSYGRFLILLEHHFDVFGLIEKGLAIDINTL